MIRPGEEMRPAPGLLARAMRREGKQFALFTLQYGIYYALTLHATINELSADIHSVRGMRSFVIVGVYELV